MSTTNNRLDTFYIYEITNNLNGKTYIGKRKCPNNLTPWTDSDYMGSGLYIQASENKYGIENFSKKILAICHSVEIENLLEIHFITVYKNEGKAEYNIAKGGEGGSWYYMTDEQKEQASKNLSVAQKHPELRQKYSNIRKEWWENHEISEEEHKRRSASHKGKKLSEEHKQKISLKSKSRIKTYEEIEKTRQKLLGRKLSEEHKQKISESKKGIEPSNKGSKWYTNGIVSVMRNECPEGFWEGVTNKNCLSDEEKQRRLEIIKNNELLVKKQQEERERKEKELYDSKSMHWYNNGKENIRAKECPEGFVPGRLGNFSQSEESKQKKRDWYKNLSEEERNAHNKKAADARRGKLKSDKCKENISKANKGRKYFNNGIIEVMQFECPPGFVPGRCPKAKAAIKSGMKKE